jgi:hypothetical protein
MCPLGVSSSDLVLTNSDLVQLNGPDFDCYAGLKPSSIQIQEISMRAIQVNITSLITIAFALTGSARAEILAVTGPNSSAQTPPTIISAPSELLDKCVVNTAMQGFNERQGVTTTKQNSVDGGQLPAGTTFVNSHMIFLNGPGSGALNHAGVTWTFDFPIIGVMSETNGNSEASSTADFGAVGTNYAVVPTAPARTSCGTNNTTGERKAPFTSRGLEGPDSYTVTGSQITLNLTVTQPGDWVRVLTRGQNVSIDIKPGTYPNSLSINGAGVIPVAILGSVTLDVAAIDVTTLNFNGLTVRVTPNRRPLCSLEDINVDGRLDLVCKFEDDATSWQQGSSVGVVTGVLQDGTPIRGTDSINIVP